MKTSQEHFTNNHIIDIVQVKKQYENHKTELENIKRSQSQNGHSRSIYSPTNKFHNLHDSMRELFVQSRQFNTRQKVQHILEDNKKILSKLKDIQKGEQDSIARQFMDMQPRKVKKKRRTKSRRLRDEIECISALLEEEDKQHLSNYNDLINAVNDKPFDSIQESALQSDSMNPCLNNHSNSSVNPNILMLRKSLNMELRKEEQRKIAHTNTQLINKIVNVQANINHKDLEKDFRQNQKYKKNVRKQSKTRQKFINNFLDSHFQRSYSNGFTQQYEKNIFTKQNYPNIVSQQINLQHQQQQYLQQQNGSMNNTQLPSFNLQYVSPYHEKLDLFTIQSVRENNLHSVAEFTSMSESKNQNSPIQKNRRSTFIKTEPEEIEDIKRITQMNEVKTLSGQKYLQHIKQRSHSLISGSQTVSVSPCLPPRKFKTKEETYKKQIPIALKAQSPTPIKQLHAKFKQQTWQRNNNLFQIQPPRSVSMLQNTSPSKKIQSENDNSPTASHFRSNRILSPRAYKFRSHNLNVKMPGSLKEAHSFKTNSAYTEPSFQIQKSLSLIESDFEDKQESMNEFEQKRQKQKTEISRQQILIESEMNKQGDRMQNKKSDKSSIKRQIMLNQLSPISQGRQQDIQIKETLKSDTKELQEKEKENLNGLRKQFKTNGIKELNQINQNIMNLGLSSGMIEVKDKQMQEDKEFQLTLNDIILKSPNQIQFQSQLGTTQKNMDNITDKEKYLLINFKQKIIRPQFFPKQSSASSSSRVEANHFTEPVHSNFNNPPILSSSNQRNQSSRIQAQLSNTCYIPSKNGQYGNQFHIDHTNQNPRRCTPLQNVQQRQKSQASENR